MEFLWSRRLTTRRQRACSGLAIRNKNACITQAIEPFVATGVGPILCTTVSFAGNDEGTSPAHHGGKPRDLPVNEEPWSVIAAILIGLSCCERAAATDRWEALSQIESGDRDYVVGAAGEVSRFQIKPDVWRCYAPAHANWRHPALALAVAQAIMNDRCAAFERSFKRLPTDSEFYILWNAPAQIRKPTKVVRRRAQRFCNLVVTTCGSPRGGPELQHDTAPVQPPPLLQTDGRNTRNSPSPPQEFLDGSVGRAGLQFYRLPPFARRCEVSESLVGSSLEGGRAVVGGLAAGGWAGPGYFIQAQ